jgi:hypothetical protein
LRAELLGTFAAALAGSAFAATAVILLFVTILTTA